MLNSLTQTRKDPATENTVTANQKLQRVEALIDELKQLLVHNNSAFDDTTICRQINLIGQWVECYCCNLITPDAFSEASTSLISDLRARLKLALDELQRLENEGGNPATREQMATTDEMFKAIRRSERLLANIEDLFSASHKHV